MKKKKLWTIFILISLAIVLGCFYLVFLKRTPERILQNQFGISLKKYNYSTVSMKEQWDYNGDGYCLIIFDFTKLGAKELNSIIKDKFKKMPINEELEVNEIPESYLKSRDGYYILQAEKEDSRNFKIFIINMNAKEGILYYQIM